MTEQISTSEFTCLRTFIREECGIDLSEEKTYLMQSRLSGLLKREDCGDYMDLFFKARHEQSGQLCSEIIDAITTNETQWFRDKAMWSVLREQIFPELARTAEQQGNPVRILSAGCSTGQEAYSAAMLLDDMYYPASKYMFSVKGIDISREALAIAAEGTYNRIIMTRGLDDAYRERYFRNRDSLWTIKDPVRSMVGFSLENLLNLGDELGLFDLVLCRNVAIYFSPDYREELFENIFSRMRRGAFLFMGASENMFPSLNCLKCIKEYGYIYFQKTESTE